MFSAESPNVVMFCDEGNHNKYAPTKHNHLCARQSTLAVIMKHPDFQSQNMAEAAPTTILDTTPVFLYKKRQTTRYVLVLDETRDMQVGLHCNFPRH